MANLIIPPAPGSPQPELSDEELQKLSPEQFDALYKQHTSDAYTTQAKAGAKEGAAGMLGTPAWLTNMAAAGGLGMMGAVDADKYPVDPQKVRDVTREATAPYSTEAILQGKSKIPFTGGLALTPEQQQPPQDFRERLARGGAANIVGTAPLMLTGGGGLASVPATMASVLGRTGAATLLGEGLGWLGDKYFPEAAPWLKAGGTMLGYGLPGGVPGGFTAASRAERAARAPAAKILEQAGQPVSVAERTGSRAVATAEQKGSARPDIDKLASGKLDTTKGKGQLRNDMLDVAKEAKKLGANPSEMRYLNAQIDRATVPGAANAVVGGKGKILGENYFKLSREWENSANPHTNKLGQILDQHMSNQSPVWAANREKLGHMSDLTPLKEAHARASFPKPYEPGEHLADIAGAIPIVHGLMGGGLGSVGSEAALWAMLRLPNVTKNMLKAASPIARSAPGQAWMGGWPTNQTATYAALLAGPGQRVSKDIWDPGQQVK